MGKCRRTGKIRLNPILKCELRSGRGGGEKITFSYLTVFHVDRPQQGRETHSAGGTRKHGRYKSTPNAVTDLNTQRRYK